MIKVEIIDHVGKTKCEKSLADIVYLDYLHVYEEGDAIRITLDKEKQFMVVQLDEALAPSLVFFKDKVWTYTIPVNEKLREAYSPKAFCGNMHYLSVRAATADEINSYQNLTFNPHDQKHDTGVYPHASANVETRNDSTFFARNAIDGVFANEDHGAYPYQSWGINQQEDATIMIDFGRVVEIDKIALVLRCDFPHDSYWTQVTLEDSNGNEQIIELDKVTTPQYKTLTSRKVEWVKLKELIKADDSSPFPALTQMMVYGRNL